MSLVIVVEAPSRFVGHSMPASTRFFVFQLNFDFQQKTKLHSSSKFGIETFLTSTMFHFFVVSLLSSIFGYVASCGLLWVSWDGNSGCVHDSSVDYLDLFGNSHVVQPVGAWEVAGVEPGTFTCFPFRSADHACGVLASDFRCRARR